MRDSRCSSEVKSIAFCATPSIASDSISNSPRRLGSAARVPRKPCARITELEVCSNSSVGSSIMPYWSKKWPPSARRTVANRSVRSCIFANRAAAAFSAVSGFLPSIITTSRPTFCGKAALMCAICCFHGSAALIMRAVSVSMVRVRAV